MNWTTAGMRDRSLEIVGLVPRGAASVLSATAIGRHWKVLPALVGEDPQHAPAATALAVDAGMAQ